MSHDPPDPIAPAHGRYEVWGESDNLLYRYCVTYAEAVGRVMRLKNFDEDNSWSDMPQGYRISPNDGNGRCPGRPPAGGLIREPRGANVG